MPNTTEKLKVFLSAEEREELESICRGQSVSVGKVRRARILLMSDEGHPEGGQSDDIIGKVVGLSERQVVRIRQQFVREGSTVLVRKRRPSVPRKLDGRAEATLVTICCSKAPTGRDHWTLQLLCDELARLKIVASVCRETVRQCLKKMNLSPGKQSGSVSLKRITPGSSGEWKKSSTSTKGSTMTSTR